MSVNGWACVRSAAYGLCQPGVARAPEAARRRPLPRGKPGAPTGRPQAWECEQNRSPAAARRRRRTRGPGVIAGRPAPPWRGLLPPITPPRIEGSRHAATLGPRGGATDGDRDGRGGGGAAPPPAARAAGQVPFFEGFHPWGWADGHPPRGIAQAPGMHGPRDALWLHRRRLPRVGLRHQDGPTRPARRAAAVPLLAVPGRAMADHIGAVPVGAVKPWKAPDAPQGLWGYDTFETPAEESTATPLERLRKFKA